MLTWLQFYNGSLRNVEIHILYILCLIVRGMPLEMHGNIWFAWKVWFTLCVLFLSERKITSTKFIFIALKLSLQSVQLTISMNRCCGAANHYFSRTGPSILLLATTTVSLISVMFNKHHKELECYCFFLLS